MEWPPAPVSGARGARQAQRAGPRRPGRQALAGSRRKAEEARLRELGLEKTAAALNLTQSDVGSFFSCSSGCSPPGGFPRTEIPARISAKNRCESQALVGARPPVGEKTPRGHFFRRTLLVKSRPPGARNKTFTIPTRAPARKENKKR